MSGGCSKCDESRNENDPGNNDSLFSPSQFAWTCRALLSFSIESIAGFLCFLVIVVVALLFHWVGLLAQPLGNVFLLATKILEYVTLASGVVFFCAFEWVRFKHLIVVLKTSPTAESVPTRTQGKEGISPVNIGNSDPSAVPVIPLFNVENIEPSIDNRSQN